MTTKTRMQPTRAKPVRIPVLKALSAANEELAHPVASAANGRKAARGWDAREVWRTRIKGERDRGSR
jgi:DNA-binding protein